MKTTNFILTVLLLGLITQNSNAQASYVGHSYTTGYYDGWSTGSNLDFATSGLPAQMSLLTSGDLNIAGSTNGYKINNNYVLWLGNGGTGNTMVGMTTANPGGNDNTILGDLAGAGLSPISTGEYNTFIGGSAGNLNSSGSYNTATGYQASTLNTSGTNNTADGYQAMYTNSTGGNNTATGYQAFYSSIQGINNTADGYEALYNTISNSNTGAGYQALYNNTSGLYNTAVGANAAYNSSSASSVTAIGNYAGYNNTGSSNTFLGDSAGLLCSGTTYTDVVCVGWYSGPPSGSYTSNYMYLGSPSITHITYNNAIFTQWSDRRVKDDIKANVPGLAFITKITPVTFHYDLAKEYALGGVKNNTSGGKSPVEQITRSGFIAQQVDSAAQACGYDFSGVVKPTTPGGLYGLGYMEFVVPLVKSVQELNTKNESLNSKVDSLTNIIQNMQTCLNQICGATGASNGAPASVQTIALNNTNAPLLYQNTPNPFGTGGTKINYYLPEGTMGATLVFYDTYGNPIKTVQLNQTGNGTLNITSDNLSSGIYSYSLIVNSNIIDTKKMVLQK